MSYQFEWFEVGPETEIDIEAGSITPEENGWLSENGVFHIRSYATETGKVSEAELDIEKLAQMAFEFDILKQVASSVEVDILEFFRTSDETTHTTGEISEATERPKSSVSRALTRLSEKQKLTKVQSGVYRFP